MEAIITNQKYIFQNSLNATTNICVDCIYRNKYPSQYCPALTKRGQ